MKNNPPAPADQKRSVYQSPAVIVAVALAIRLVAMAFNYGSLLDPARGHYAFGYEFGRIAQSIATGHGFSSPYPEPTGPSVLVGPVYAYLLAGIFKLFGVYTPASAIVTLTLNNLSSAFTCLPIYFIALRIFGPTVAARAGWCWALFPYSVAGANVWVWETVLTTLILTSLLLYTLYLERSVSYAAWVGYGLLWALSALTSAATLSTLPFFGLWILARQRRNGTHCIGPAVVASLVFWIAVAPWIWRSSHTYGRFVAFRGNFGLEVMVGNSNDPSRPSDWNMLPGENHAELVELQRIGEPAYMAEKQQQAKDVIENHTLYYVRQTLRRIVYTWTDLWEFPPKWSVDGSGIPDVLTYSLISLLAFAGLYEAVRTNWHDAIPLMIPVVFFPIVYYLTHQDVRFRHPIDPVIVIFAVYGVLSLRGQRPENVSQPNNL
jgi:4-amino-4-deoxy-L-arabinose transferase-like glycosyltransferase